MIQTTYLLLKLITTAINFKILLYNKLIKKFYRDFINVYPEYKTQNEILYEIRLNKGKWKYIWMTVKM